MSKTIGGGISTRNPFGPDWGKAKGPSSSEQAQSVGEQVQSQLFGKKKPALIDEEDAHIAAQMARMRAWKNRLARLAGDEASDYQVVLAQGTIAMIDQTGLIYVGKQFLLANMDLPDVLVGVLAHEIGHRPKRWDAYRSSAPVSQEEQEKLCRLEETRADYFAGRALAELNLDYKPLVTFLKQVAVEPHPAYFSAGLRAEVIEEGFVDGKRKTVNRAKFFPELQRMHGASGDLGTG